LPTPARPRRNTRPPKTTTGGLGRNDDVRADAYEAYADLLRQTDRADEAQKMADQAKAIRDALKE